MSYQPRLAVLRQAYCHDLGDGRSLALVQVDETRLTGWACIVYRFNGVAIPTTKSLTDEKSRNDLYDSLLLHDRDWLKSRRAEVLLALAQLGGWVLTRPNEAEVGEAPAEAAETAPLVQTADSLMRRTFPPLRPVVDRVLLEGVILMAGRPKLGKSWLMLSMGVAVAADGKALGTLDVRAGDVLYLALEDGDRRLQRRLAAILGEGAPPPPRFFYATQWPRLDNGGTPLIRHWIEHEASDPRLIIVDTMARLKPATRANKPLYEEDYNALAPLADLVKEHPGLTLVLVTHTRKLDSDDPMDLISGSTGLTGSVDGAIVLKRDRGAYDAALHVYHRDAEEDVELALKRDDQIKGWVLAGDASDLRLSPERRAILTALRAAGKALSPKEIAEATWDGDHQTAEKHQTVTRALLGKMLDDQQIRKESRGNYVVNEVRSQRSQRSQSLFAEHEMAPKIVNAPEMSRSQRSQSPAEVVPFPARGAAIVNGQPERSQPRSQSDAPFRAQTTGIVNAVNEVTDCSADDDTLVCSVCGADDELRYGADGQLYCPAHRPTEGAS